MYLGLDLGTSGLRAILVDEAGIVQGEAEGGGTGEKGAAAEGLHHFFPRVRAIAASASGRMMA